MKRIKAMTLTALVLAPSAALLPAETRRIDLSAIASPVIFRGDATVAYRDPAVIYDDGWFRLFFEVIKVEPDKRAFIYTAWSKSRDLVKWSAPVIFTPRDQHLNFGSPGNNIRHGGEWVLCLQTYPRPNGERYGNANARIWTMRSKDLETWGAPELLRVKGPGVPPEEMGRMIDPFLFEDQNEPGKWWCFYKQNGVGMSWSHDLKNWTYAGRTAAGENACVIIDGSDYVLFHSPANGIGVKRSKDLREWRDEGVLTLGQSEWPWAGGRLTAGVVLDLRKDPLVGEALMFFHGSDFPENDSRGGFDNYASIGLAWSDDLKSWTWPGKGDKRAEGKPMADSANDIGLMRNVSVAFAADKAAGSGLAPIPQSPPTGVPSLEEMAGDWMKAENVLNPPAINNRRDLIQVRYDLVSTRFNPGGAMMPQTATGVPFPVLTIDGLEYPAQEMRWCAYEARRRNRDCAGLQLETVVRMVHEDQGFLTRISVHNPSSQSRAVRMELQIPQGTEWAPEAPVAINRTLRPGMVSVFLPVQKPEPGRGGDNGVVWRWQLSLPAGGSSVLEYVVASDRSGEAAVVAEARRWAGDFPALFAECQRCWQQRWTEAFTPGNGHFSGHLPIFETADEALRRIYYMGALTMLCCERSQYKISPRDFLTETDRPGKQYFWDASMMATAWALLEPAGMKASLRQWLACDLLNSHGFNIGSGTDMKPGWYAFSGANVFYTVLTYVKTTGDRAFLDERLVAGGQTILQRLDEIAMLWTQRLQAGQSLVNWSNAGGILLESSAPTYFGCVASLNAQSVGMMREMAELQEGRGNAARAQQLRAEAEKLLPAVLNLYKPGEGVWDSILRNGQRSEQRHCVDFIYVTQAIATDFTDPMRREILNFVRRELMMTNWLRAMSLKDPGARKSERPDHGPMGAYDGWVPLTVAQMCRLGAWSDAVDFFRRTASATREGPYAQAHEFCGPRRMADDAPICVATGPTLHPFEQWIPSRGEKSGAFSSKECICGGAFADVIIGTLFGFQPDGQGTLIADPSVPRPFAGKLRNVRYRAKLYEVEASSQGLKLQEMTTN